jgi:rubrerythrin
MEEMEETMAELYKEMSHAFSSDEEASALFARLSREEMGHKLSIQLERRIIKQNPKIYKGKELSAEVVKQATAAAQELKRNLRGLSLREAVSRVLALEESGAEQHCKGGSDEIPPALGRLLSNLRAGDKAHLEALEAFAKRRGVDCSSASKGVEHGK